VTAGGTGDVTDPELVSVIAERLGSIRARIRERTDRDVTVVAVTKGLGADVVAAAVEAGCGDLGESYAQEMRAKLEHLTDPDRCNWHFIGRLQSNKVRQLAGRVDLWQSVDRPDLAEEIARRDPGARILVQLDLAGLPGRGGCPPSDAPALVERCVSLGLQVTGLMGVGVPGPPEASRRPFRNLVAMAEELALPDRSIGMSGDLDVAVEEGATMVRIGTALVGPRPPTPS
jgi:PLP dependent protein